MIYNQSEYCKEFKIHINTLRNRIKKDNLPSNHIVKAVGKRGFVIITDKCLECEKIEVAVREYFVRLKHVSSPSLAAELSIKYKINTAKFFRTVGL